MKSRGLTSHSKEELWNFSNDDLRAISDYLAGKKYFFGREHPTSIDCTIFGHLSQILYIPMNFPQKQFVKDQCPNLIRFMENFKVNYWSDWEQKCVQKVNQKFVGSSAEGNTSFLLKSVTIIGVMAIILKVIV